MGEDHPLPVPSEPTGWYDDYPAKLPWWANTKDDGDKPLRQHGAWIFTVTLKDWMLGVSTESWENTPGYGTTPYWHRYTTYRVGPLWFMHESFKDITMQTDVL